MGFAVSPIALAEADECTTKACLDKWKAEQEAYIKSSVPSAYQAFPLEDLEKEYKKDLAKIEQSASIEAPKAAALFAVSPIALAEAHECTMKACLDKWKVEQEAYIKSSVPK